MDFISLQDIETLGKLLGGITTIIVFCYGVFKYVIRPTFVHAKNVTGILMKIQSVCDDLQPNGGKSLRDVIDRIEKKIVKSDMLFRALLRDHDCGIFECDTQGNNIYVNRTYTKKVGVARQELLGLKWMNYISDEDMAQYDATWKDAFNTCDEFESTIRIVNVHGAKMPCTVKCYPIIVDSDRCSGYLGIIHFLN